MWLCDLHSAPPTRLKVNPIMATGEGIPLINKASICPSKKANWHKKRDFYFNLIRRCLAEFVGTALYMFAGITSVSNFIGNNNPHLPTIALTFGFAYAGLSGAALHVRSGYTKSSHIKFIHIYTCSLCSVLSSF